MKFWGLTGVLLMLALATSYANAAPTILQSGAFTLNFAADGKPSSLRAGTDELLNTANPGGGFALLLKNAQVPLSDVFMRPDGKLVARSANGTQSVVFALSSGAKYLTLRLVELKGVPASSPLTLQFQMNAADRVRVLDLDYMTEAHNDNDGVRVNWNYLWNRVEPPGGFALYVRQNEADEDDTLLHLWVEEKLPHPKITGAWTLERARAWLTDWQKLFADRSQMILEGQSLQELRDALPFAAKGGIKEIYLFTNTWHTDAFWPETDTSWGVNRKVFPRGEDDLRAFSDQVRALGMRLNLHCVSGGIGQFDPLYVAAKPDHRLASWGGGQLAGAVDGTAKELVLRPAPGVELPYKGNVLGRPPEVPEWFEFDIVRLENELVRVGEFAPQADGTWLLHNCQRGLFNTKAMPHAAGAETAGLLVAYGQNFVPDNDSTLLDEIAANYAGLLNRCGIAHTEYDGAEIHTYSGNWGYQKFAAKVYELLDHPVTAHDSSGRAPRANFEYRFNSTRNLLRGSNPYTDGNWSAPVQLDSNSRVASTWLDANFVLSQGHWGGALGLAKPEPMFGVTASMLRAHGLTDRFLQTINDWRAVSQWLTPAQHAQINALFAQPNSKMPEASLHVVSPVVLTPRKSATGYDLVPVRVLRRPAGDILWQVGQEHGPLAPRQFIKPGEVLHLDNPDAPQTPYFIMRVGWALDARGKSIVPGTSAPAPVAANERLNDLFTGGNTTEIAATNVPNAPNFWLQPGANALHLGGDSIATVEGNALRVTRHNARDQEQWELHQAPSWDLRLDMTTHRALGMDITGDGSGAMLLIGISGRDYVVPIDFKGRRHIEIPNGEVAWSMGQWGWRMDTKRTDYAQINNLRINFGYIPARTDATVLVENLQALAERPTTLQNPVFHSGDGTLTVQGDVASGQYLEYQGGDSATVYDPNWQKLKTLPVTRQNFSAPGGAVTMSVTTTQTAPLPWLETQFLTQGTPLVVPAR